MAGDWIKMQKSLPRDPRVVRISSACNADRLRTVGGLFSVWCLFDEQTEDGKLDGYTPDILDDEIRLPGLAHAMESVGWLEIGDGFLAVPRFEEHNGKSAKRRGQESVRKMSARHADKKLNAKQTKCAPREEKNREDIIPPNPQGGMGDEPQGNLISEPFQAERETLPANAARISEAAKKRTKVTRNTALMERIGSWFARQPATLWTIAEVQALLQILPPAPEIEGMENYYMAAETGETNIRRRDLLTLLNNWQGELDRARAFYRERSAAA